MKTVFLVVMTVVIFSSPALAIDSQKLDTDTAAVGSFLQRVVNPRSRGSSIQGTAIHCEGYGIVVTFYTYFDSNRGYDPQFTQDNEELTRALALYLSTIRQLKENEKVVVVIKNSNQPYQTYTVQAENNDLLSFLQGKMKLEELAKRVRISQSATVGK